MYCTITVQVLFYIAHLFIFDDFKLKMYIFYKIMSVWSIFSDVAQIYMYLCIDTGIVSLEISFPSIYLSMEYFFLRKSYILSNHICQGQFLCAVHLWAPSTRTNTQFCYPELYLLVIRNLANNERNYLCGVFSSFLDNRNLYLHKKLTEHCMYYISYINVTYRHFIFPKIIQAKYFSLSMEKYVCGISAVSCSCTTNKWQTWE